MSREERRQYQRQMKSMERGPALPPAARARAERTAARRSARRGSSASAPSSRRFWVRTIVVALAAGFLAFSFQWPNMPFALYVGATVTLVVAAVIVGFRMITRRAGPREDRPRGS